MKTLNLLLVAFLFTVSIPAVFAQNADEIISKYITTIGGAEKLKALKGVKIEMILNQGMEIPLEIVQLGGGKTYLKINMQGKEITQLAFDGKTGWSTNFMTMKAEKLDSETTENMLSQNQRFPRSILQL